MNWIVCAAIYALLLMPPAGGKDSREIEQQFRQTLENKLLRLRTPYAAADLKCDLQGNLLGKSEILSWTTHVVVTFRSH
jgi:hypothetical protein